MRSRKLKLSSILVLWLALSFFVACDLNGPDSSGASDSEPHPPSGETVLIIENHDPPQTTGLISNLKFELNGDYIGEILGQESLQVVVDPGIHIITGQGLWHVLGSGARARYSDFGPIELEVEPAGLTWTVGYHGL